MKETPVALIIESDDFVQRGLSAVFRQCGFATIETTSYSHPSANGLTEYSVVVCEIDVAQAVGLADFVAQVQEHSKRARIVVTSVSPDAGQALDALGAGAYDFIVTPPEPEELKRLCCELSEVTSRTRLTDRARIESDTTLSLVGRSKTFIDTLKHVGRVAPTNLPVFLVGESGTGKEVLATVLHQRSNRAEGPFVPVNCAALPAELIESELFGHVKGSFTGADRDRPGLWEQADGGTIFLDEVTETSTAFQVKLLRTLQRGEVRRVGSNTTQRVDVRVVAASNRDVEAEVQAGRFRQDLFYRLNAISIELPPLRERKEDIPLLVESFVQRFSGKGISIFSRESIERLSQYSWPGNIRELENVVLGCLAVSHGVVNARHLPERIHSSVPDLSDATEHATCELSEPKSFPTLAALQREYVTKALTYTKWNKQAAARLLAVDRKTLDRMIKRHGVVAKVSDLHPKAA